MRKIVWRSACTALFAASLSFPAVLQAEDQPVGLSGLLPSEMPEGLSEINLQTLPAEWQTWGEELKAELAKLYSFENRSLEEQQTILESLESQLDRVYAALEDSASREHYPLLTDLEGKLVRRLDVMQAVQGILAQAPEQAETLRPVLQQLVAALEGYEADALEGNSDTAVREQLARIEQIAPDSSALLDVIRIHYFNFNMRAFVSKPFAEYVFNERRRECGPVCDFILGARVSGNQHTNSGVSINFIPSDDSARFSIHVQGNTRSNTRGVNNQATIYTYGNHYFSGRKIIRYADDTFSWERANLGVNPNNTVTDAKLNRRGLVAKLIGDKIAYNKAVELTPQTESIAASRLRARVLPKFNREVENTFRELNEEQAQLRERMARESIAPNEVLTRTDKHELRTAERLMNPGQLGADRPTKAFNTSTGLTLHIHESWINNALARETLEAESQEMTFPDFGKMLVSKFERAFEFEAERETAEDDADTVLVYDADPLHVQFDNSKIKLVLRIGLRQSGREDIIKLRRVEIPLKIVLEDDVIRLVVSDDEIDRVRVLPLDPTDRRPIANRIMGEKIRTKIEERLADKTFDRHLTYKANKDNGKEIPVTIAELHAVNGWLVAVVEPASEEDRARMETCHSPVVKADMEADTEANTEEASAEEATATEE